MSIPTTGSTNGFSTNVVATATTAAVVIPRRAQRYRATIKNLDTSIVIYIGSDTNTGPTTGMPLRAGESIAIYSSAAIWAESASGTPSISYLEEAQD